MATQTYGTKQPDFKALIDTELGITITSRRQTISDLGGICEFYIDAPSLTPAQSASLRTWRDANWPDLYLEWDEV